MFSIQKGFMKKSTIHIPTLWCSEPFCILKWEEEETYEDLKKRYGAFNPGYGTIENVLRIKEPRNYEKLFGIHTYQIF